MFPATIFSDFVSSEFQPREQIEVKRFTAVAPGGVRFRHEFRGVHVEYNPGLRYSVAAVLNVSVPRSESFSSARNRLMTGAKAALLVPATNRLGCMLTFRSWAGGGLSLASLVAVGVVVDGRHAILKHRHFRLRPLCEDWRWSMNAAARPAAGLSPVRTASTTSGRRGREPGESDCTLPSCGTRERLGDTSKASSASSRSSR